LRANEGKSFQGSIVLGMGFTFDDEDATGAASPIADMRRLIALNPRNGERIFPFISGEELNGSPTFAHRRYVISFEDWPLRRQEYRRDWIIATDEERDEWLKSGIVPLDYPGTVAADFPDLLSIVETKVKPERQKLRDDTPDGRRRKRYWWQWGRYTRGMFAAIAPLSRALVNPLYGSHLSFVFMPTRTVFANKLNVIPLESNGAFAVLQSRVHEIWGRFFSSTLKDDLAYTPTDCFETFPFPNDFDVSAVLNASGSKYYQLRTELMTGLSQGLTSLYNAFHDPESDTEEITRLRECHDSMDRVVLDSYTWTDVLPKCEFISEFDDDEDEDDNGRPRRKKYRYRWPDEIRDEVLARLLELNRQRALEEGQFDPGDAGALPDAKLEKTKSKKPKAKSSKQDSATGQITMNLGKA
jgi:hypothetical protein